MNELVSFKSLSDYPFFQIHCGAKTIIIISYFPFLSFRFTLSCNNWTYALNVQEKQHYPIFYPLTSTLPTIHSNEYHSPCNRQTHTFSLRRQVNGVENAVRKGHCTNISDLTLFISKPHCHLLKDKAFSLWCEMRIKTAADWCLEDTGLHSIPNHQSLGESTGS